MPRRRIEKAAGSMPSGLRAQNQSDLKWPTSSPGGSYQSAVQWPELFASQHSKAETSRALQQRHGFSAGAGPAKGL